MLDSLRLSRRVNFLSCKQFHLAPMVIYSLLLSLISTHDGTENWYYNIWGHQVTDLYYLLPEYSAPKAFQRAFELFHLCSLIPPLFIEDIGTVD